MSDRPIPFQAAICAKFGCAPEAYAETVFWRCLYPHAHTAARILGSVWPQFFQADRELIRELGATASRNAFGKELDAHRYHHPPDGFLRGTLKLRVSGRRLMALAIELLPRPPGDTASIARQAVAEPTTSETTPNT